MSNFHLIVIYLSSISQLSEKVIERYRMDSENFLLNHLKEQLFALSDSLPNSVINKGGARKSIQKVSLKNSKKRICKVMKCNIP